MKTNTLNTAVGLFVLVGILCLGYLSVKLGRLEFFGADRYLVHAYFDSVSGLKKGAAVEIAGVEIGSVNAIELDSRQSGRALVDLQLSRAIRLQDDVIASVRTRGLIGDKFILLKPGGGEKLIAPGGVIRETESSIDLEELFSKYVHGQLE